MRVKNRVRTGALVGAVALAATGCLGGGGGEDTVEILGAFSGTQQEGFEADIAELSEELGIEIELVTSDQFEVILPSQVAAGNAPDIAIFPQPGLLKDLVADGDIVSLEEAGVDVQSAIDNAIPGIVDTATVDGVVYGLPYSVNGKSFVWYPVPEFDEAGYGIPTTHAELVALSDQIKADGTAPWCFGVDAGWVATDWIEDYVLRTAGPEVYDQWVNHEIPFNDPQIVEAGERVGELLLTEGNMFGGAQAAGQTFDAAVQPMFDDPPSCYLHRQGNFITAFFPQEVRDDLKANVDLFSLPPVEGGFEGQPMLGGGDFMAMFDAENENAARVLEAIASPDWGSNSAQSGAWLSPYVDFDTSHYPNDTLRDVATALGEADVFRFDGSDSMPGEIGNGSFWTNMVQWTTGQKDLNSALNDIESDWAALDQ